MRTKALIFALALVAAQGAVSQTCHKVVFDGEVHKGEAFSRRINPGLQFSLRPLASGWKVEVLAGTLRLPHDAAESATPPYQSVNPLFITTDYSFRAQDAISWNPRKFQFATDPATAASASQDVDTLIKNPPAPDQLDRAAEGRLVALATHSAHGQLRIMDATLVPGTADQTGAAAAVASHWRTTPHTLAQPKPPSASTPLGEVQSMKFEVTLWLPRGVPVERSLHATSSACEQ